MSKKSIPFLWVGEDTAKALGCTYEAVLFGVPGYSFDVGDEDGPFEFVPKLYPLTYYLKAADWLFDTFAGMLPEDKELVTPYRVIRTI